ncbi:TIGR02281 family clan AA aspartic protease [Mesorhizobium sp. BAC0120]|uniref:TIGR02281 family clan AA aspartic protease n=1 Tax=Mesorhizobium sp. BAC0120 TaxID=3090670 RepID=UPI00298BF5EA|nr:TIGR02281 family clan AA aspartic protease [Mesorhizobium sp. BAC0120]MDW6025505.1 TIGR02281 family clan AA aspartic protease [Mesorhizobium sp. BAC0120]
MLRKFIMVGIFAASSASIPAIYQSNPEAFQSLVRLAAQGRDPAPPRMEAPAPELRVAKVEPETLPGHKVRLAADPAGHFLAEFKFNGRRVNAMIDTGATLVAINRSTAKKIGISLTPADFKYQVTTANGNARAAAATIDSLEIGRIAIDNVQAVVLEDKALDGTLIGMSFLKQLRRFEVEDGALLLVQ